MSINAVERVRQVMDLRQMQIVAPLIEHGDLIQSVTGWMSDAQSKAAFEKELAFYALHHLTNESLAIQYAGNMPLNVWQEKLKLAEEMIQTGKLPLLETGSLGEYWVRYLYATTFLIEQYKYAPHVGILSDTNDNAGDVFLDCGACFGDTSIWSVMQGASKVYAFEPSLSNASFFRKNIITHKMEHKIELVPLGLGKEIGEVFFQQDLSNAAASRVNVDSTGDTGLRIPITTLDIWCAENKVKPDFIKMDIEGAEVDAIIGAQNIIKEYKPRLAICLYHRMSDLWNIPYLIKQICPEYQLWCRKNAHVGEFVLYAKV